MWWTRKDIAWTNVERQPMQLTTSASFHRIDVFRISSSSSSSILSHRCESWIRVRRWRVGGCELATHVLFLFCCCSTHVIIYKLNIIRLHTQLSLDSQPVQTISKRQENKRSSVPSLRNASRPTKQLTSFTPLRSSHSFIHPSIHPSWWPSWIMIKSTSSHITNNQSNHFSTLSWFKERWRLTELSARWSAPNRATRKKMKHFLEHQWISSWENISSLLLTRTRSFHFCSSLF